MKENISLKDKAKELEPTVRIGKQGINENIIKEIKRQLNKKGLIKIKFLRSSLDDHDKKTLANMIIEKTKAKKVSLVGFTLSIKR